jgi:hypothetical protein
MSAWDALAAELDAWAEAGTTASFWWRDDDAAEATPALDRLLDLRARLGVPLAIAAIPATAQPSLAGALGGIADIAVLQHGWAHRNHAAPGEDKIELGARAAWDIAAELARGRARLIEAVALPPLPVLVPPWNRIEASLLPLLPGLGYDGLSGWAARPAPEPAPGLRAVNTHVDIIDWHGSRGFAGDDAAIGQAVAHLAAKRSGAADADEPTGLLTHHLAHDDGGWAFIERFVAATIAHGAARWDHAGALFE